MTDRPRAEPAGSSATSLKGRGRLRARPRRPRCRVEDIAHETPGAVGRLSGGFRVAGRSASSIVLSPGRASPSRTMAASAAVEHACHGGAIERSIVRGSGCRIQECGAKEGTHRSANSREKCHTGRGEEVLQAFRVVYARRLPHRMPWPWMFRGRSPTAASSRDKTSRCCRESVADVSEDPGVGACSTSGLPKEDPVGWGVQQRR